MLRTLLVFAILIPGLVAALVNRYAGLLLYVWFALFRPVEFTWIDISGFRLSFIVGIAFVVPSLLTGIWPNLSHPLSIGGLIFFACALFAQTDAINAAIGWTWVDFLGRLLLVCLLAITLTNSRTRFLMLLTVIAVSFGFHSAKAGLDSLLHGGTRFAEGLSGAFSDNNGYALGMVMTVWLLVAAGQNSQQVWIRRALFALAPLTAFGAVSTFSRGGFLALAASTPFFLLLQRRRMLAACAFLVFLFALPFIPLPEGYTQRIETIRTYEEVGDDSALSRLHFWRVAVDMAAANPFGVGLFNYEAAFDRYDFLDGRYGRRRSVHSSFFQVLAETGFLGALVYCSMLGYSLVLALKIRRLARTPALDASESWFLETSANGLATALVAFMIGGAFISLALNDLIWLLFALVATLDRLSAEMCANVDTRTVAGVIQSAPSRTSIDPRPAMSRFVARQR